MIHIKKQRQGLNLKKDIELLHPIYNDLFDWLSRKFVSFNIIIKVSRKSNRERWHCSHRFKYYVQSKCYETL